MENQESPKFIQNRPSGSDKFDSQSQIRLKNAIENYITNRDSSIIVEGEQNQNVPKIIGLEGCWGSGKSNVIKLLKNSLKEKYYTFEYDAWGHQEDLQRRSFLESLTKDLISDKIITGKTKSTVNPNKEVNWSDKLLELLAKRVIRVSKTIPVFNQGAFWTILSLSLTPISVFISERLADKDTTISIFWLCLIAFAPIILGILTWITFAIFNKEMRSFGYLLKISKDVDTETRNYETINEDEPTVDKFILWMRSISDHLAGEKKKKLIIVFDNMDRLPAEKVKQLWSSIHTFFAEEGFENIWTIIPYDETHLVCAFGDEENIKHKELTRHFINKTFPIVYRVAHPVMSDYKDIFNKLFIEAYGSSESENQIIINRIFRIERPSATVRDIISFINQTVAIKLMWNNQIDLKYIAIFALKKDELLNYFSGIKKPISTKKEEVYEVSIEEHILSGDYLGLIPKIVPNDETMQTQIAALVYNIDKTDAEQIPFKEYLKKCFSQTAGYDINKFASSNRHFMFLLEEIVEEIDSANIDNSITCLFELKDDEFTLLQKNQIQNIWNEFSKIKLNENISTQDISTQHKLLILKADDFYKKLIIKTLYNQIYDYEKFSGANYYQSLKDLENFISENTLDLKLPIKVKVVDPTIFIDYVTIAKEDYNKYELKTDSASLENYYIDLLPSQLTDTIAINYISKDTNYKFKRLLGIIENLISNKAVDENNFFIIFNAYKAISNEIPLKTKLQIGDIKVIFDSLYLKVNSGESTTGMYDILALALANQIPIPVTTLFDGQINLIASSIQYYSTYGELLISCTQYASPLLNNVLNFITVNKLGIKMDIGLILPQLVVIASQIGVTEEQMLDSMTLLSSNVDKVITQQNIQALIPNSSLFRYVLNTKNELTNYINDTIINALKLVKFDMLYSNKSTFSTFYWFDIINIYIDSNYLKSLPDNLTQFGMKIIDDIASETQSLPVPELFMKIINLLDKRKTMGIITDLRTNFCNGLSPYIMTIGKFIVLEKWLREQGRLNERIGDVFHFILIPVLSDPTCLNIIITQKEFYTSLINNSTNEASYELKEKFRILLKTNTDEQFIEFCRLLSVEIDQPES